MINDPPNNESMNRKLPPDLAKKKCQPLIQLNRVSRFYRSDRAALFDITLDIYPGEFLYIAGASGAGKSTLMRIIHGAELPDTGSIVFAGCDLAQLKPSAICVLRRSVGQIFQDFRLIPNLSVAANIGIPLEVAGLSGSAIRVRVEGMLEQVGLAGRGGELASQLSGGEQQRVAVARAIVGQPDVLLADEPTGSLDAYHADFILNLLEDAAKKGAAVVLATHDRLLISSRPHRMIALKNGRIIGMSSDGSFAKEPLDDHRESPIHQRTG